MPPTPATPYPQTPLTDGVYDPDKYRKSYVALQNDKPFDALRILFNEKLPYTGYESLDETDLKATAAAAEASNDRRTW